MKLKLIRHYLEKQKTVEFDRPLPITFRPDLIVVIPCYNEPDVLSTLESLTACQKPDIYVEVLLVINANHQTPESILQINRNTYRDSLVFATSHETDFFKIIPLYIENLQKKPGVGVPRKMGMDEATRRFAATYHPNGVIVSLDADCKVENNYLSEIYRHFKTDTSLCSATIDFHHPVEHLSDNDPLRQSVFFYETYLHYFRLALLYSGFPYAYNTIGSAMAFRAFIYAQAQGMGKQQAGEDFYFLHKIFPMGKTKLIDTTRVYPAARISDRVPFGTGPALNEMISQDKIIKYVYNFEAFQILKLLFNDVEHFFKISSDELNNHIQHYPKMLHQFLKDDDFVDHLMEINLNTSTLVTFKKRFFNYFTAFKIIKFLNFVHPDFLELKEVCGEYTKCKSALSI